MSLLVGCPVILPPWPDVVASWTHRPHLLIINGAERAWANVAAPNTGFLSINWDPPANAGVARSWNLIFGQAAAMYVDHVALVSQGTLLDGGTDRLARLVAEHADWRGMLTDFAWHCIVLSVELWKAVGPFDEQFWPAYYEDCDYVRRLEILGLHTPSNPIPKVGRDLLDGTEQTAAALTAGVIDSSCYGENGRRYAEKWGGSPGHERLIDPKE